MNGGYVELFNALVQKGRWITVTDTADTLDTNCGSAYSIFHRGLRYKNTCKVGAKATYR
jgi:hypothetical protein